MIEMRAFVTCDRCNKQIAEMHDIEDMNEVHQRLSDTDYCVSEDGDDVCGACWKEHDAKFQAVERDGTKQCGARQVPDGWSLECTRTIGHEGAHVAHGEGDRIIGSWGWTIPAKPSPAPSEALTAAQGKDK